MEAESRPIVTDTSNDEIEDMSTDEAEQEPDNRPLTTKEKRDEQQEWKTERHLQKDIYL